MAKFQKGDMLVIKEAVKKELVAKYHSSEGMSGVSPHWVNSLMEFKHYYGSNVVVLPLGRWFELSLNQDRFEKKNKA